MSQSTDGLGGVEYYLETDETRNTVSVMRYVFNVFHPNGQEQKLVTIGYDGKHGYTYHECKELCVKLLDMLQSTNWECENNVY